MFARAESIKWVKYSADSETAVLLVHGGCFTEGDEWWNAEQAETISKNCNVDVYTINFSKKSFQDSTNDIQKLYMKLCGEYKGRVGIIGCSSGGFLVLSLLNKLRDPLFVTLVCPVMNPESREDMLLARNSKLYSKIHSQQLEYFKARPYPQASDSDKAINIIAANEDENVPLELIEDEITRYPNASLQVVNGTHVISYNSCDAVMDIIKNALLNVRQFAIAM